MIDKGKVYIYFRNITGAYARVRTAREGKEIWRWRDGFGSQIDLDAPECRNIHEFVGYIKFILAN